MSRTTVEKVRAELEADGYRIEAISGTQIETVGIGPAHLVVNEDLTESNMSDDRLKLIERYLAGHFILSSGVKELRQTDSESLTDGSSVDFSGDREYADYRSTSLGQKAVALDASGTLDNASKPTASIRVPDARGYSGWDRD